MLLIWNLLQIRDLLQVEGRLRCASALSFHGPPLSPHELMSLFAGSVYVEAVIYLEVLGAPIAVLDTHQACVVLGSPAEHRGERSAGLFLRLSNSAQILLARVQRAVEASPPDRSSVVPEGSRAPVLPRSRKGDLAVSQQLAYATRAIHRGFFSVCSLVSTRCPQIKTFACFHLGLPLVACRRQYM